MFFTEIALEPMAEFKKFTASLLTPTTKSTIAKMANAISIKIYGSPINNYLFLTGKVNSRTCSLCYLNVMNLPLSLWVKVLF